MPANEQKDPSAPEEKEDRSADRQPSPPPASDVQTPPTTARDRTTADNRAGGSSPRRGQPRSSAEALEWSTALQAEAAASAKSGQPAQAFVLASEAFSLARRFPNDAGCAAAANTSRKLLEELESQVRPSANSGSATGKTLIEK